MKLESIILFSIQFLIENEQNYKKKINNLIFNLIKILIISIKILIISNRIIIDSIRKFVYFFQPEFLNVIRLFF